jgi:hypothetical protein
MPPDFDCMPNDIRRRLTIDIRSFQTLKCRKKLGGNHRECVWKSTKLPYDIVIHRTLSYVIRGGMKLAM